MAFPRIITFTMQPNFAELATTSGVQYVGQAAGDPAPLLSTVRFYQYQPVQDAPLAPNVPQAQGYEINNLFVNDPGGSTGYDDYFFLGMALHEENGRARLSVAIAESVFDASKYPTMKQVRFRGWEQIMVPTKPAPTNGVTNFTSWEQNGSQPPGVPPQSRLALTDYLATLTATPVALGVNVPGAGRAFLAYADCSLHGLTFRVTAEFDFAGTQLLP